MGDGPLLLGLDENLERRYGKKISARGVYRDLVRSTHETLFYEGPFTILHRPRP